MTSSSSDGPEFPHDVEEDIAVMGDTSVYNAILVSLEGGGLHDTFDIVLHAGTPMMDLAEMIGDVTATEVQDAAWGTVWKSA